MPTLTLRESPVAISRSKLEPPVLAGQWVRRTHVEARLDRGLTRSLTIVVAPAGHGKTSTIASWLRRRPLDAAWVTVDSRDADITRFATHVAVALDRVAPGVAPALFTLLMAPDRLDPAELGEAFGEALYDLERDVLLVLDDFHAASTSPVSDFLSSLIVAGPRRLHTIICSRVKTPIPLSRLRTTGDVEELTGADLRFSVEETSQLLRLETGESVDPAQAASLQASVGGWPAAVRLIALSGAAAVTDQGGAGAEDRAERLRDYLGEEVLTRLPEVQRNLLLRASLVERFNVALLEALVTEYGGHTISRAEVEQLRALDLFREIPGLSETWFAYHPLFREVLRRELERTHDGDAIEALRRRIARWFAAAGLTREAVSHLVELGDVPAAAALIESRLTAAFAREDWRSVSSWLRLMPWDAILEHPELLLASGWVSYLSGREGRLADVLAKLRDQELRRRVTDAQRAEMALLAEWPEDDPEAWIALAEDAIARIPPSRRYRYGYAHMTLGMALTSAGREEEALARLAAFTERESTRIDAASIRGYFARVNVLWQRGRLAQCEQTAADQLQLAAMNGLPITAGWGALYLGAIAHERGELAAASRHAGAVIADAEHVHFLCLRAAFFLQILAYEAQGQRDQAGRAIARLRELAITSEASNQLELVNAFLARTALIRGDLAAAKRWLDAAPRMRKYEDLKDIEQPILTRIRILLGMGTRSELIEAERALADFVALARSRHMALALLEGLAIQALVHEAKGDPGAAAQALRESLDLAAPEGIVQRYAYLGPALAPIVHRLLADRVPHPHARAVLRALDAVHAAQAIANSSPGASRGDPLLTPLTGRERDVVRLLALRMTNNEIGQELFISPITVKNHVAHIYDKLGVSGRRSAVARAGELGLLGDDA